MNERWPGLEIGEIGVFQAKRPVARKSCQPSARAANVDQNVNATEKEEEEKKEKEGERVE